jgi:hypothetical protein
MNRSLAFTVSIVVVLVTVGSVLYIFLPRSTYSPNSSSTTKMSSTSNITSTSCVIQATQIFIPTLADLKNSVSAIVVGKVTGLSSTTLPADHLSTVHTIFVNQTLKGEIANRSIILVSQFGRSDCPAVNDPPMNDGLSCILFLYSVPNSSTAVWGIYAGQQGRFLVQNGRVDSLDVLYPYALPTIHVQDVPLDQFIRQVKAA